MASCFPPVARLFVATAMPLRPTLTLPYPNPQVGDGWSPPEPQHCWQASTGVAGGTALSSTGAAAATSGPTGGMGGMGAPGGMSMSMMGPQGPMGGPGALMSSSVMVGSGGPGMGMQAAAGPGGGAGAGGAGGGAGSSITYQAGLPPSPDYTWVGTTTVTVPRLQPGGEVELQLAVGHGAGWWVGFGSHCPFELLNGPTNTGPRVMGPGV